MFTKLRYVIVGSWPQLVMVLLCGIALNVVYTALDPLILKFLVDEGLVQQNFRMFALVAIAVVLFGVGIRIARWAYSLFCQRLKNRVAEALSLRMLGHFYHFEYREVAQAESGYFLSRVYDEPARVAEGIVNTWINFVNLMVAAVTAAAVALYLDWKTTLSLSLLVPILYYLAHLFRPRIAEISKLEKEKEARLREQLNSTLDAYSTIKIFDLYSPTQQRIAGRLKDFLDTLYSRVKTSMNYQTASHVCLSIAEASVLLGAGYSVVTQNMTIGGLFGFLNAFWKLITAVNGIIAQLPEFAKLDGYIDRLKEFEDFATEGRRLEEGREGNPTVLLQDLGMRYGDEKTVFEQFNLDLGASESVLILGPNGSGKTTLAYLMTGLLRPTTGDAKVPDLKRISALLTPFRFVPGTLRDNVDFDRLDRQKVDLFWTLAQELGLEDKVDQDPTQEFSEGEKKKAQVLMTLLKDADVYLFDEPLAHVDQESKERIIQRQFERGEDKSLIVIMHGDEQHHSRFDRIVSLG